jgi:hypothetical protein
MKTIYMTKRCPVCFKVGSIAVEEHELFTYLRGEYVGRAFQSLTAPFREQIISGVHPECWQKMWGEERVNENIEDYRDDDADYDRMKEEGWLK